MTTVMILLLGLIAAWWFLAFVGCRKRLMEQNTKLAEEQKKVKSWVEVAKNRGDDLGRANRDVTNLQMQLRVADEAALDAGREADRWRQAFTAASSDNKVLKRLYSDASQERTVYRNRLSQVMEASRRTAMIADGRIDPRDLPVHIRQPLRVAREAAEQLTRAMNKLPADPQAAPTDKPKAWANASAAPQTFTPDMLMAQMMRDCGPFFPKNAGVVGNAGV